MTELFGLPKCDSTITVRMLITVKIPRYLLITNRCSPFRTFVCEWLLPEPISQPINGRLCDTDERDKRFSIWYTQRQFPAKSSTSFTPQCSFEKAKICLVRVYGIWREEIQPLDGFWRATFWPLNWFGRANRTFAMKRQWLRRRNEKLKSWW